MSRSAVYLLHLSYWLLYTFLVSFLVLITQAADQPAFVNGEDWAAVLLFTLLTGVGSFYAFYTWLVPRYLMAERVRCFLIASVLLSFGVGLSATLLFSLVTSLIIYSALHQWEFLVFRWQDELVLLTGFMLLAVVNGLTGTGLRSFLAWYTDKHLRERLTNKSLRTELALLKARINPHFLFNTLNNIDILIEHDAPRASLYLNKLAHLLRFSLYETQADQIPLTREVAFIQEYIDLQKLRTPNPHYVTLHVEGDASGLMIAPTLFIPYVENAFKYAANKKAVEAIRIKLSITPTQLCFQCVNVIEEATSVAHEYGGLGQALLQQRLALLYPTRHALTIQATQTTYSVNLTISF